MVRPGRLSSRSASPSVLASRARSEETPPATVAREMVQGQVAGDGFQPAARGRAFAQHVEALPCLDEHLLGDVLGLRGIARKAGGRRENHVLIGSHERRELRREALARG